MSRLYFVWGSKMKKIKNGLFICFCGIGGAGKSTQINRLAKWLTSLDYDVLKTRQPTRLYRNNRFVRIVTDKRVHSEIIPIEMLALLSAADRIYHISNVIKPNLKRNRIVLCDRYVFSAYASMMARGLDKLEWLRNINNFVITPDLVFLLDVPAEIALKRIMLREKKQKKEKLDVNFLRRFRQGFLRSAKTSKRIVVIDGLKTIEEISLEIKKKVSEYLP